MIQDVTKEGMAERCWVLPGITQDMTTVERVKKELAGESGPHVHNRP